MKNLRRASRGLCCLSMIETRQRCLLSSIHSTVISPYPVSLPWFTAKASSATRQAEPEAIAEINLQIGWSADRRTWVAQVHECKGMKGRSFEGGMQNLLRPCSISVPRLASCSIEAQLSSCNLSWISCLLHDHS